MNFFGVAWAGDLAAFTDFIERHGLTFDQIDDRAASVYAHFGIPVQPALVVVGRTGDPTVIRGAVEPTQLDGLITAALDESTTVG